jgi:hypothetical protein
MNFSPVQNKILSVENKEPKPLQLKKGRNLKSKKKLSNQYSKFLLHEHYISREAIGNKITVRIEKET